MVDCLLVSVKSRETEDLSQSLECCLDPLCDFQVRKGSEAQDQALNF